MKKLNIFFGLFFFLSMPDSSAQALDPAFNAVGTVVNHHLGEINAITTQADGKIITAGYAFNNTIYHFQVVRYKENGNLDSTFGIHGVVNTEVGFSSTAKAVAIQPDGKIVVSGTYYTGDFTNISHAVTARYLANGTTDASFGNGGIVMSEIDFSESVADMVLQPDGKIVIGGAVTGIAQIATTQFMLARFNTNGTPDNGFGIDGVVRTTITTNSSIADIAIQPDGKIVAGGYQGIYSLIAPPDDVKFALARYDSQGSLDPSFGTGGIVSTNVIPGVPDAISSIAIRPDGKIIAGGNDADSTTLVRYQTNGNIDLSFGSNGFAVHPGFATPMRLVLTAAGSIVTAGTIPYDIEDGGDFLFSGYLPDGAIDPGFGNNGRIITNLGIASTDFAYCLTIQPDGKTILAGSANGYAALARYTTNGSTATKKIAVSDMRLSVYPNPFREVVYLVNEIPGLTGKTAISLTNMLGQYVWTGSIKITQGKNTLQVPNLPAGNYILSVYTGEGILWNKKITRN